MQVQYVSLILASGSAIRKAMLEDAGIACSVIKPQVDEEALREQNAHLPIPQQALLLARAKAQAVARANPQAMVLAADQICELEGVILSKPGNHANAVKQLTSLQGKTHHQHSAACLYQGEKELWSAVETAMLTMRPLTAQEIEASLRKDEPYQSCGSYMYEKHGKELFADVQGGADVIQGLPLKALLEFMRSL